MFALGEAEVVVEGLQIDRGSIVGYVVGGKKETYLAEEVFSLIPSCWGGPRGGLWEWVRKHSTTYRWISRML